MSIHLFVFSCLDKGWILTVTRNVIHKWKQWANAKIRLGSNSATLSREHSLFKCSMYNSAGGRELLCIWYDWLTSAPPVCEASRFVLLIRILS